MLLAVHDAEMTPEQAEAWAKQRGLPSFTKRPEFSIYDPLKDPIWTILQTYCWIAFRDLERLRDVSPRFRSCWRGWRMKVGYSIPNPGWIIVGGQNIENQLPFSPQELFQYFDGEEPTLNDPEPYNTLWEALVRGKLIVSRNGEPVPLAHWIREPHLINFHGVSLRAKEVLEEWPPDSAADSATTQRGRKHKIDWEPVRAEMARLMRENGEFSPANPHWNCQASLERATTEFIERELGEDSVNAESTIRRHVKAFLAQWRAEN